MKTYLGIDVGSISTDFVLINDNKEILASLYIRTEGNPITAVKRGLKKVKEQISEDVEIWGVGTTGSARYLAGVITGADLVKNEITAHAKASSFLVPDVKTIIEIGGQDSKIIILEDGVAIDFGMNAICLSSNSEITTNPNYSSRPIKEVKIGQHVLTHQGDFQEVDQAFERHYRGEMINIEVSNLKKIDITPEHPILGLKRKDIQCYQDYVRKNIVICKPPEERTCKKRCNKHKDFSWEPKFIPAMEFRKGDFVATPLSLEIHNSSVHGKDVGKIEDDELVNIKRHNSKSFIYSNFFFEPIRKIRKHKFNGNIYNFKVANDDSYVVNNIAVHNCAAGTGSFLDAQAFRLEIPIENFGEVALKSNDPTTIASRCTIFAESDMIHKQQVGHTTEDIVAGLCQGLARNYLAGVGKGKNIQPPIVFQGGVSENKGMIRAFEKELGEKVIVPEHNIVMGALGVALLAREQRIDEKDKGKFRGWDVSNQDIKTSSFICDGCPNQCEVIEAKIDGKVVSRWGDRCGKWSNLRA